MSCFKRGVENREPPGGLFENGFVLASAAIPFAENAANCAFFLTENENVILDEKGRFKTCGL